MDVKEWKKTCKVTGDDQTYEGIAHIVEVQYDERFRPWFGAIQLSDRKAMGLPRELELEFEGGKKALCRFSSLHNDGFVVFQKDELETPTVQIYVIGKSALSCISIKTNSSTHFFDT